MWEEIATNEVYNAITQTQVVQDPWDEKTPQAFSYQPCEKTVPQRRVGELPKCFLAPPSI
jgi:hypothetical protein